MCVKEIQNVLEKDMEGFSASLNADKAKVEDQWLKYLKTFGKVNKKNSVVNLSAIVMGGFSPSENIHSTIKGNSASCKIWWGIEKEDDSEAYQEKLKFLNIRLTYFVYQFMQQELQEQLKESERAAKYTGKTYQDLINENNKLEKDIFKISKRKQKLEQKILELDNLAEELTLQTEINKVKKEKAYEDLEKINKVLESNKQKLSELAEQASKLK